MAVFVPQMLPPEIFSPRCCCLCWTERRQLSDRAPNDIQFQRHETSNPKWIPFMATEVTFQLR